jgi:uncharacterized protein (DUF1501 family)
MAFFMKGRPMANQPIRGTWHDDPAHFRRPTRRDFMQVGFVGGFGLSLGGLLKSEANAAQKFYESKEGKAKSLIHVYLPGGMAAQETWDPKLLAPIEYRGPLGSVATKLDGVRFGEMFKNMAGIADKITVVRSMTHNEAAHERGTHNMFTGYRPSPALKYPSFGAVISHEFGPRKDLPPYVAIPQVANEYAGTGYLSSAFGPFSLGSDPSNKDFTVRDLSLPQGVEPARFDRRRGLLAAVDEHFRQMEKSDQIEAMDSFYQRAYSMISSKQAREAFNIAAEPDAIRNEYGQTQAGQRMLMARRLVESGVRYVSLTTGSWDHHDRIQAAMERSAPMLDQALSTLIRDLDRRGMLDSTLVMVTSEFGRTPKINNTSGRDHYPKVYSIMLAGGGVKQGFVYGSADATGTDVESDPLSVPDLACTVYHQLGINSDKELMAPGDRPIEIVDGGHVVKALLA